MNQNHFFCYPYYIQKTRSPRVKEEVRIVKSGFSPHEVPEVLAGRAVYLAFVGDRDAIDHIKAAVEADRDLFDTLEKDEDIDKFLAEKGINPEELAFEEATAYREELIQNMAYMMGKMDK